MERESVKVDSGIMERIREIAKKDGMVLAVLVDRLLEAGLIVREKKSK